MSQLLMTLGPIPGSTWSGCAPPTIVAVATPYWYTQRQSTDCSEASPGFARGLMYRAHEDRRRREPVATSVLRSVRGAHRPGRHSQGPLGGDEYV